MLFDLEQCGLEGCVCWGSFAAWTCPGVLVGTREAETTLGTLLFLAVPAIGNMVDFQQVDSGIEVHKRFGFYLPGFLEPTSKMTWGHRVVGISMALREYAPITNMLSLILLPIATFPSQMDRYGSIVSEHSGSWSWLRSLFLVAYLARKLNNFVLYSNIGLQRLAILQSLDIWCAPCKSNPTPSSIRRVFCPSQPAQHTQPQDPSLTHPR